MNKVYICLLLIAALFTTLSCSTEVEHEIAQVASPTLVSSTPASGATGIKAGNVTINLTYDKNVFFASQKKDLLSISNDGSIVSADVIGSSPTLVVVVNCPSRNATYTFSVPEGLVTGPNSMPAPAVEISFTTLGVDTEPVYTLTTEAQNVYNFLQETYEQKTISGIMANVAWNTEEAERVYSWTGKYPALNCFDYIHLNASAAGSWIDYGDITPVRNWWNNGGLVAAMWHWNVPVSEGSSDVAFYKDQTSFDIDNAFTEGTWEYQTINSDLAKVAGYLKLLKDAGIPVIWRPLHEAAGGWFWWGKNAESFKKLWIQMFDYFKAQGLDNLIWVWTTETGDTDWYPGDQYVDIIGRDLYGNDAADCASQYQMTVSEHGNKMVTLSECGANIDTNAELGLLSEQWNAGARWLWFMPWYDGDGASLSHANQEWWLDAMSQTYVISRDQLPSFK